MTTTPNYGWPLIQPTDFVTDLPADFETFADAVDADLAGLLGGTTGQVLAKDSDADHDFSWTTVGGAGKVLQVVSASTATQVLNSTITPTDTGLTATITPTSASSTILVIISQSAHVRLQTDENYYVGKVFRDATEINSGRWFAYKRTGYSSGTEEHGANISIVIQDSPTTTSATTYKTQAATGISGSGRNAISQANNTPSYITLLEIGA
jgi:hypothetical protein